MYCTGGKNTGGVPVVGGKKLEPSVGGRRPQTHAEEGSCAVRLNNSTTKSMVKATSVN